MAVPRGRQSEIHDVQQGRASCVADTLCLDAAQGQSQNGTHLLTRTCHSGHDSKNGASRPASPSDRYRMEKIVKRNMRFTPSTAGKRQRSSFPSRVLTVFFLIQCAFMPVTASTGHASAQG